MNKKELKKKFKDDIRIVQTMFNSLDPAGLIRGGSSSDEYECLTTQILSGLYAGKSHTEIEDLILAELDQHFAAINKSEININFSNDLTRFIDELISKIKPCC